MKIPACGALRCANSTTTGTLFRRNLLTGYFCESRAL
jgi:hypothetical protein